jgi:fumarate reductase flavoprotein subunit
MPEFIACGGTGKAGAAKKTFRRGAMKRKAMKNRFCLLLCAVLMIALAGCESATSSGTDPTITAVTVSPKTATVGKGGTQQFSAEVTGTGDFNQAVTWSVTGGGSGTAISTAGLLTVAANETAATLTVTAASAADNTKKDTAAVTVRTSSSGGYTGTVSGSALGFGGQVTVTLTLENGTITQAEVKGPGESPGYGGPIIAAAPAIIVRENSVEAEIDALSTATTTIKAVKEAGRKALEKALYADVVVVGSGLTGFSAAVKAAEEGASVILLEKQNVTGGSSARSGGGIGAVNSPVQQRFGIQDSAASWKELWQERQDTSPTGDKNLYPNWDAVDWLLAQGADLIEWVEAKVKYSNKEYGRPIGYGFDVVERIHFPPDTPTEPARSMGSALIWYLEEYAKDIGVRILLEHKATELALSSAREVTGVKVDAPDGEITVSAKAVVLAAGGFAQNREIFTEWIPSWPTEFETTAAAGATGDGILMALDAGAILYEEPWVIGGFATVPAGSPVPPYGVINEIENVYVDSSGARVMNEAQHYAIIINAVAAAEGGILYSIYDSSDPKAPTFEALFTENANRAPYLYKGETLEALATAAGFGSDTFTATIANYNTYADGEEEDPLGKTLEYLELRYGEAAADYFKKIETGPFYAVKVVPAIMGTIGGVKTNVETGAVLKTGGGVIPGLYAAGENANHIFLNQVYMSGGALAIASTTGRAAGAGAAGYAKTK